MAQNKQIAEDLEALNSLKDLAESYEEIAVIRMQKIRESVLSTRDFLAELSDVFVDLKTSYNREMQELLKKREKGDKSLLPVLQKKGENLMVYLASNGKLYGSVTQKTFHLFMADLLRPGAPKADVAIIGGAGKEMFDGAETGLSYQYFEIPDTNIKMDHIKAVMKTFLQYDHVHVYYGKFGNVINQAPIATSITGDDIFETEVPANIPREDKFVFEPTLEKIFHFFETQIVANLFSQTLLENQLARHASRVNAMEEALVHIEVESVRLNRVKNRIKHQLQNKKQLETVSGVMGIL